MTNLIYRGISHTGAKATAPRTAQAFLYRGVAHDGVPAPAAHGTRAAQMRYRGVPYIAVQTAVAQAATTARLTGVLAA